MINVIEYELIGDPIVVDSLFTDLRIEKDSNINKLVFSIAVDKICLTKYLDYFKEEIIGLTTSSGEYFEVLDDFLLNKRMCEKYTYRLLFNIKDVEKSPSDYSNIILDKTLDNLVTYIIGNDKEVNNEVIAYLNNMYNNSITVEELQNVSKDLILIRKGIELGKIINPSKKEDSIEPLFDIVEGFDVSLHAFLIIVVNGLGSPIKDNNFFSKLYQTIKNYFNSCDIKDVNINKDNYRQIIHSICNSSSLIEKYRSRNQKTRIRLMCIVTEILLICLEIFEQNKTNGIGNEYKNIHIDIVNDMKDNDILKVFLPFLNINRKLFFIRQTLETIESKEENVERN